MIEPSLSLIVAPAKLAVAALIIMLPPPPVPNTVDALLILPMLTVLFTGSVALANNGYVAIGTRAGPLRIDLNGCRYENMSTAATAGCS